MGIIVKYSDIAGMSRSGLHLPIYCKYDDSIASAAIPINIPLAEKLSSTKTEKRTMRLEKYFCQIVAELPSEPIIRDFDVMFNPKYEVDVLRIMCSVAKTVTFSLIWPGRCEDGKLIYAEEGYNDYKIFDIDKYDVTCII